MPEKRKNVMPELPDEPPYSWTFEAMQEIQLQPRSLLLPKPEQVENE